MTIIEDCDNSINITSSITRNWIGYFDVHISVSEVQKGNNKKSSNSHISMLKVLKLHSKTV